MVLERHTLSPFSLLPLPVARTTWDDGCVGSNTRPPPKFSLKVVLLLVQHLGSQGQEGKLGKLQVT